ncbi:MAG TPA: hypothetical protein VE954_29100 [Oligoflexus sp.]|uniref:hypothetical protein n=1 Tax=Oligoflexus sp. TaxID=1971216 RepID=UPI002D543899|nr:hypothetical protein [Oligoflexus sp.]HYX37180.1 hypothetical protein [Oligoflexus sp.]
MKVAGGLIVTVSALLIWVTHARHTTERRQQGAIQTSNEESPEVGSAVPLPHESRAQPLPHEAHKEWVGGARSSGEDSRRHAEDAKIEAMLTFLEELRSNLKARPHLDAVTEYLRHAPSEAFSIRNLPTNAHGLAVLDGNSSMSMIKDENIRKHWDALMDIILEEKR